MKIKEQGTVEDPKWGEVDLSFMKNHCVDCGKPIKWDIKRYLVSGNYCVTCSAKCGENMNHRIIDIKPYAD